ncbi:acylphosphatase [Xanthobacteraceae bacterium A53D]
MSDLTHLHLLIHGRVQGVGYRAWFAGEAEARGLSGFVRNRTDGTVEAAISGPEAEVEGLAEACLTGPRMAAVIKVDRAVPEGQPAAGARFRVLPTL